MRATVYDRYGAIEVLRTADLFAPPAVDGEVRVRVRAAALNPKDALVRKGRYRLLSGSRFPKQCGLDFAGEIIDGGEFVPGTPVYGCLSQWRYHRGTLAEQVRVLPDEVAPMPAGLSFEEAAALPLVGLTSLQALVDIAKVGAGQPVCINGGSGGVGTVAIQIARTLGARVTSVSSARNRDFCRALGADEALAYDEDRPFAAPRAYRAVFDAYGNRSYAEVRPALARGGTYVTTVPSARLFGNMLALRRARLVVVRRRRADLDRLASLVVEGKVRPVIEEVFPFHRVHDAFRRLESRRARGKLVVTID